MIAGAARALSTALIVIRAKVVAVLLGPHGIGLLGLYAALQEIGAQTADGGAGHSSVRQIAAGQHDPERQVQTLRALCIAIPLLGLIACALIATWRTELAVWVLGEPKYASEIAVLGFGVGFAMIARVQQAVMAGHRRVSALARVTVLGALIATLGGLALIWMMGDHGLIWAVLLHPIAHIFAAFMQTTSDRPNVDIPWTLPPLFHEARAIFAPGAGLMLSAVAVLIVPLLLRAWLARVDGLEMAGLFHAGSVVALHVSGLLLAAVAMDLYPRLAAARDDSETYRIASVQARIHLMIGGPVMLVLIGFAPLVLTLLYDTPFRSAAPMLQWMLLGGLLKLVSVPLETILTAQSQARAVLLVQIVHQGTVLGGALVLYPMLNLEGIGIAVLSGQALHLMLLAVIARTGRRIMATPSVFVPMACFIGLGGTMMLVQALGPTWMTHISLIVAGAATCVSLWTANDLGVFPWKNRDTLNDNRRWEDAVSR